MPEITKMQFSLERLFEIFDSVKKVANDTAPPVQTRYRFAKIAKAIHNELKEAGEARDSLIEKLGEKNKDGGFSVKPENMKAYQDEWKLLSKEEAEISFVKSVLDEKTANVLSGVDMLNLEPFFTEDSLAKIIEDVPEIKK